MWRVVGLTVSGSPHEPSANITVQCHNPVSELCIPSEAVLRALEHCPALPHDGTARIVVANAHDRVVAVYHWDPPVGAWCLAPDDASSDPISASLYALTPDVVRTWIDGS
ncbi:hypothetical protein SAMN00768000_0249 [Sulfobacillus thermosulfidooxidans DSM 9293]|uniref:Uncharacterized protein n=1 Tax=Sulfobacillus thermosulfidooxidans (strain DSM 9293 / VKM B-1269 / AT-1) TaxID=929705 RepID=A0A1W1W7D3_SULTA|nr:hypothetical protein [Sulfobacillus thermosulfidooxidans]SMC02039.1 hypothetical protein SAMN00768000_0249 [Sulfobacillus thermosulfidooxidans DSM 9293]